MYLTRVLAAGVVYKKAPSLLPGQPWLWGIPAPEPCADDRWRWTRRASSALDRAYPIPDGSGIVIGVEPDAAGGRLVGTPRRQRRSPPVSRVSRSAAGGRRGRCHPGQTRAGV